MKISIITATYNSQETISETINSILAQTHKDIDYIIIDGGSTDKTIEILRQYEPFFNGKLKWISEKDNGIYDAMNKGIKLASGEIIGILNSDDYFTNNKILETINSVMTKNTALDAIYGDVHFINDKKKCIRYYSSKIFKRELMVMGFMPAHPTFYCRKECFHLYGMYKTHFRICSDFDLLLRFIYKHNIKIQYIPLDMVTMRTGGISTSGIKSHLIIMKEHMKIFKENHISTNYLLLIIRYLYKIRELKVFNRLFTK